MALIVYGGSVSPFVRKVRVVLAEKGLGYSLEQINPFSPPPDFAEISPLKRIPAFRDTDLPEPNTLADSSVICDYPSINIRTRRFIRLIHTCAAVRCGSRNTRTRRWPRIWCGPSSSSES